MFSKQVENTSNFVTSNFPFSHGLFKRLVLQTCKIQGLLIVLSRTFPFYKEKLTLTVSDSNETGSQVESEIVRVVSLKTTEITQRTRLIKVPLGR